MNKSRRRELEEIIARNCNDYDIEMKRSGHVRITLRYGGQKRYVFCSGTPSDHRARMNVESDIKKMMSELHQVTIT